MTPMQVIFQMRHRLAALLDTDGSTLVFGVTGARVAIDMSEQLLGNLQSNSAFLNIGSEQGDPEVPQLSESFDVECLVFLHQISDIYGAQAVRHMLRVSDLIIEDITNRTNMAGVSVIVPHKSATRPFRGNNPLAYRALTFRARNVGTLATDDRLPPATGISVNESGGDVTISWTRPAHFAKRFDYIGCIVRRKVGSAPTSVTDGDSIQTITDNATVIDVGAPSGTVYYSVFVGYDEDGDTASTADEFSSAISGNDTVP